MTAEAILKALYGAGTQGPFLADCDTFANGGEVVAYDDPGGNYYVVVATCLADEQGGHLPLDHAHANTHRLAVMGSTDVGAALIEVLEAARVHEARSREYRNAHDLHGDGSREAGRAWDLMRRSGNRLGVRIDALGALLSEREGGR